MTKKQQQKVLSLFNGTSTRPAIRYARKIAEIVGVPRRQVMSFLEKTGKRDYSPGSFE